MTTLAPPKDIAADRRLQLERVTPYWVALLAAASAERGLPPEPWPLP